MPDRYTARAFGGTGGNTSPPWHGTGAPKGTLSFIMTLFDRDARSTPSGWWHWVVYDLPKDTDGPPEVAGAEHSKLLPSGARQGRSDLGEDA